MNKEEPHIESSFLFTEDDFKDYYVAAEPWLAEYYLVFGFIGALAMLPRGYCSYGW